MEISVIMPVFNETIYELKKSINSILSQSYKDFEFIIIDDNPNSKIIKKFLLQQARNDNRIKVYFNKRNVGAMKSANIAIKLSNGKYIARMDADDVSCRDRLAIQLSFCKKNGLDFSSCNLFSVSNNSKKIFIYSHNQVSRHKIEHLMYYVNIATGPTLFFNRQIVKKIGGYRNILAEDYDLAMRMLILNYKVGYLATPLVYKRFRKNSLSETKSFNTFIALHLIKKFSKETNFTRIIPISYIYMITKKLDVNNYKRYHKFIVNSINYKNNKSVVNLIRKYYWACSSIFILKRNLIILRNKSIYLLCKLFYKLQKL